jgi:hypothetical protein
VSYDETTLFRAEKRNVRSMGALADARASRYNQNKTNSYIQKESSRNKRIYKIGVGRRTKRPCSTRNNDRQGSFHGGARCARASRYNQNKTNSYIQKEFSRNKRMFEIYVLVVERNDLVPRGTTTVRVRSMGATSTKKIKKKLQPEPLFLYIWSFLCEYRLYR